MTFDAVLEVHGVILDQVEEIQGAIAPLGVARVRAYDLDKGGQEDPRAPVFTDHDGRPIDIGDRPFGVALPEIYRDLSGQMFIRDRVGECDLNGASSQVFENLNALVGALEPFQAGDHLDLEIPFAGSPRVRVGRGRRRQRKMGLAEPQAQQCAYG